MFRPVFRASLRQGFSSATRRYASARTARSIPRAKLATFATFAIISSALLLPSNSVSNDADQEKIQEDQKSAQTSADAEKTAFELTQETAAHSATKSEENDVENAENAENPEEAGSQSAAFNPETGEINWDCPCLGGMAHGPCGEEFKAAFACFVYSETEPKGIDCIGKFEAMRTCFRQHPEHYKEELYEDDEPVPSTEEKSEVVEIVEQPTSSEHSRPTEIASSDAPVEHTSAAVFGETGEITKETATEDIAKVA